MGKRTSFDSTMRRVILFVVMLVLIGIAYWTQNQLRPMLPEKLPPIDVYFSPKGGCTDAVVREIDAARNLILVQAYSFTSKPIADALVEAHRRGVDVRVLLDSDQEVSDYSVAEMLLKAGISTRSDDEHAYAHNKIIIIDDRVVITGSFNFSKQAEQSNAENLLIIRDEMLAKIYTKNWEDHAGHCRDYEDRSQQDRSKQDRNSPVERRSKKAG